MLLRRCFQVNPEAVNQLRLPVTIIHGTVKKLEVRSLRTTFDVRREKQRPCKPARSWCWYDVTPFARGYPMPVSVHGWTGVVWGLDHERDP